MGSARNRLLRSSTSGGSPDSDAGVVPLDSRLVIAGDSIPTAALVRQHLVTRSMGRLYLPLGFGQSVSGERADQTAADAKIAAVNAIAPDAVWLHVGTNSLAATSDTPATIFGYIHKCVTNYTAPRVAVGCVMPRVAPNALTAEREADRIILNTMIRSLASNRVRVVDIETTYDPATMAYDGLHPNGRGAPVLADEVIAELNIASGSILDRYLDDSNLIKAAGRHLFAGTAGSKGTGFTGNVGTGWGGSSNGTDLAVECSIVADFNGAPGQRFVISGTSGSATRNIILSSGIPYSGVLGESYEAWAEFQIEAGSQNCYGVFSLSDTAGLAAPNNTHDPVISADAYYGVARQAITSTLAGSDTSNNTSFSVQFAAGVVAATITWGKPGLRKVA